MHFVCIYTQFFHFQINIHRCGRCTSLSSQGLASKYSTHDFPGGWSRGSQQMDRFVYPKWGFRVPVQVTGKEMIFVHEIHPSPIPKDALRLKQIMEVFDSIWTWWWTYPVKSWSQGSQISEFEFCQWIWFSGHNRAWDLMGFPLGYQGFPIMLGLGFDDLIDLHVVFLSKAFQNSLSQSGASLLIYVKTGNYNSSDFGEPFSSMKQWQQMNLPCFTFKIPHATQGGSKSSTASEVCWVSQSWIRAWWWLRKKLKV